MENQTTQGPANTIPAPSSAGPSFPFESQTGQSIKFGRVAYDPGFILSDQIYGDMYRAIFETSAQRDARLRKESAEKLSKIENEIREGALKEACDLAQLVARFHNVLTNHMSNQEWVTGPGDKTDFVRELTREYFHYLLDEELDDE